MTMYEAMPYQLTVAFAFDTVVMSIVKLYDLPFRHILFRALTPRSKVERVHVSASKARADADSTPATFTCQR
jgi:hypothetical protein